MSEWRKVTDTEPRDTRTVLTYHVEDLYPVTAFAVGESDGARCWFREAEGPEETYDGRKGKHEPLYRPPTHWMELPELPEEGR